MKIIVIVIIAGAPILMQHGEAISSFVSATTGGEWWNSDKTYNECKQPDLLARFNSPRFECLLAYQM